MCELKVLITGTSSGIGRETAKKFLNMGHRVIGMDIKPDTLSDYNYEKYEHKHVDICGEVIPRINGVDILINNAGVQNTEDDISVNLKGTINITEQYLKYENLRSIVMVCSVSAHTGSEFPEYAASKGGMLAYTKNVAKRCAEFGCTCNSISPGGVYTELNAPVTSDKALWNEIMSLTPLHKWATVEEIAEWIYFMSVINKSMTGQDIIIDNGEMNNSKFIWPE